MVYISAPTIMDKGVICNDKSINNRLLNHSKTIYFQIKKMQTFAFYQPTWIYNLEDAR